MKTVQLTRRESSQTGFVEFSNRREAERGLQMDGSHVSPSEQLIVDFAKQPPRDSSARQVFLPKNRGIGAVFYRR